MSAIFIRIILHNPVDISITFAFQLLESLIYG